MDKPVVIEYKTGVLSGARYVVVSAAKAAEVHPDAVIVGYEDGSAYQAAPAKSSKTKADAEPTGREVTMVLEDDGSVREALP